MREKASGRQRRGEGPEGDDGAVALQQQSAMMGAGVRSMGSDDEKRLAVRGSTADIEIGS